MDILILYLAIGLTAVTACVALGLIGLKGFTAWIGLKHAQLEASPDVGNAASAHRRIDVADLRERVRRLEGDRRWRRYVSSIPIAQRLWHGDAIAARYSFRL